MQVLRRTRQRFQECISVGAGRSCIRSRPHMILIDIAIDLRIRCTVGCLSTHGQLTAQLFLMRPLDLFSLRFICIQSYLCKIGKPIRKCLVSNFD